MNLPRRVTVEAVLSSRYRAGNRPISWDDRSADIEKITTVDGETIMLFSNGGQSSPAPGWELLLTEMLSLTPDISNASAYTWTLYGIPPKNDATSN